MINENTLPEKTPSFFHLPFQYGTFKLNMDTLNKYSDFRRPKRPYLRIQTRKISFQHEVLTLSVILANETEEKVYIKVSPIELLVSCSVDTDESYLSRYAYFALCDLMGISDDYDFDTYYWPDLSDPKMQSKFLMVIKSRGSLYVGLKVRYHGLYKPGKYLLTLVKGNNVVVREIAHVMPPEAETTADNLVLGYNLAYTLHNEWHTGHYPFLIPYIGTLNKDTTAIKGFNRYILKEQDLPFLELTSSEQRLNEICLLMKEIAPIHDPKYKEEENGWVDEQKVNKDHYCRLFELWHEAFPLLQGKHYTHSRFTYGLRNVKRKPPKTEMRSCTISNEQPELCFLWKEKGDYFKLELRFMVGGQLYELPDHMITSFFVRPAGNSQIFYLLNSIRDCEILAFFSETDFRMLFLKVHYEAYFRYFVDQLREIYRFINQR